MCVLTGQQAGNAFVDDSLDDVISSAAAATARNSSVMHKQFTHRQAAKLRQQRSDLSNMSINEGIYRAVSHTQRAVIIGTVGTAGSTCMKRSSVCPSACLSHHSTTAAACGGFAAERRASTWHAAATAPQHGAHEHMRATAPCCQLS